MKINMHILGLLVVVGLFSLQSCDDESYDIEGSNQNYVYINVNRLNFLKNRSDRILQVK